ncbi:Chaperone protein HtpG [Paenibacillus konkukensis]|uniref:Chaperone protein HtpG n=1 Tax=Paenibacillus konkukensis TaxID=2020716 RepID=A0ABY4RPA2_9BACL|nr:HSP90 family protein [Paenibacillus konkukensis]UQZ83413.1 Chaperone protein HtpG [Paenibacillus konkukensis]
MSEQNEYRFQVNLSGMINILSNHLYSSPKVYLRELLQNATDAITARNKLEPASRGQVTVDIAGSGSNLTMTVDDNGIGLTEEDIHRFLAMIGHSSKVGEDFLASETSFIGRFGIGLLSCFMVSEEIVVLTQSAQGGPSMEWRGKPDGTYTIRKLETRLSTGTRIYLRCKPGCESYFEPETVKELLFYYGALLPYPVILRASGLQETVNASRPIWIEEPELARGSRQEVLAFGQRLLGERFHDFIPLRTANGRTGGIAYILPRSVNLNARRTHRVYLKQMLVSDQAENILPEWAFFVKCLVWTDELQPTASREHFYEDERLQEVRSELGQAIREELMRMGEYEPDRLQHMIGLHVLSMKALAAEDTEFLSVIYRWLPFESTYGERALGELLDEGKKLYYTLSVDEYRQIAHVAAAQSQLVLNGGYIYNAELLEHLAYLKPELQLERLVPEDVSLAFTDLTLEEKNRYYEAIRMADAALQSFKCQIQLKRFKPAELPALYTLSKESSALRSIEKAKESSPDLLASVLGNLGASLNEAAYSTLYFNLDNPMIERIFSAAHPQMLPAAAEVLYTNALMMGHYPMTRQELSAMNRGIIRFIDWGLEATAENGGTSV